MASLIWMSICTETTQAISGSPPAVSQWKHIITATHSSPLVHKKLHHRGSESISPQIHSSCSPVAGKTNNYCLVTISKADQHADNSGVKQKLYTWTWHFLHLELITELRNVNVSIIFYGCLRELMRWGKHAASSVPVTGPSWRVSLSRISFSTSAQAHINQKKPVLNLENVLLWEKWTCMSIKALNL